MKAWAAGLIALLAVSLVGVAVLALGALADARVGPPAGGIVGSLVAGAVWFGLCVRSNFSREVLVLSTIVWAALGWFAGGLGWKVKERALEIRKLREKGQPATMSTSPLYATIDLRAPGKQLGHIGVPYSHNLGGWANLLMPIAVVANGDGPTALVMAGNHGDEYPGPIAILKLMRSLQPEQVRGRVILIPALNLFAAKAATRLSPWDGKNLNRCFPGRPDGTLTEQVAHYLTTVLFPLADIVIDIHTGGRSMDFVPCAHMHLVPDREQRRKMKEGTLAWNCDFAFLYADIAGTGLLPVEAENQGKVVITTEMGGSENVTAAVHRVTQDGLRNVLIHLGVVAGEKVTRAGLGLPPTRWVQALDRDDYRFAPESGLYENLVPLGTDVAAGQPVGQVHFLERPDREPEPVVANRAGVLVACRAPTLVGQGDCVACIAHDVGEEVWG